MVQVGNRIRLLPDTKTAIRPVVEPPPPPPPPTGGGGGVPGRLGRPRMVELFRSRGSGNTRTLTVADRYVDPTNGNDANNGLSRTTAWRTMGKAADSTAGQGLAIGYMSGNLGQTNLHSGRGAGANFSDRVNTHYVLANETCTIIGDFSQSPAIWVKDNRYLQFSGFQIRNTNNRGSGSGGIDWSMATHTDGFDESGNCHHIIHADMTGQFFGQIFGGQGASFIRVLGCEAYDGAWYHAGGGSNFSYTRHYTSPTNGDFTPVGFVDGIGMDMWFEACFSINGRQKVGSSAIGNANRTTDGNGFILGDLHSFWRPVRAAFVNCIAISNGGKGFNMFNAAEEVWYINCLAAYNGRHRQYVQTQGDPVFGLDPVGQAEFLVQAYTSAESGLGDGTPTKVHWWNCVAKTSSWNAVAFATYGSRIASVDARNNKRVGGNADPYSAAIATLGVVNEGTGNDQFDARPVAGSPLLTGGDLSYLARAGVTKDFAGNTVGGSGAGHVGPYSVST